MSLAVLPSSWVGTLLIVFFSGQQNCDCFSHVISFRGSILFLFFKKIAALFLTFWLFHVHAEFAMWPLHGALLHALVRLVPGAPGDEVAPIRGLRYANDHSQSTSSPGNECCWWWAGFSINLCKWSWARSSWDASSIGLPNRMKQWHFIIPFRDEFFLFPHFQLISWVKLPLCRVARVIWALCKHIYTCMKL